MSAETMPKAIYASCSDRLLHVLLLVSLYHWALPGLCAKYSDAGISIWFYPTVWRHRADQTHPSHVCRHAHSGVFDCARRADRLSGVRSTVELAMLPVEEGHHRLLRRDEVQSADDRRSTALSAAIISSKMEYWAICVGNDPHDLDGLRSVEPNSGDPVPGPGGYCRRPRSPMVWRRWLAVLAIIVTCTSISSTWRSSNRASSPVTFPVREMERHGENWNSDWLAMFAQ